MAGEMEFGYNVTSIVQTGQSVANFGFYFVLFVLIGLILFLVMNYFSFGISFRIKEIINGRKVIKYTKCKIKKNKDGSVVLKLRSWNPFDKFELPCPPDEAIEIDIKGRRIIEAYQTSTNEYIYLKDNSKLVEIPKEILDNPDPYDKYKKTKEWKEKNNVISAYEPITANQRMFFIGQIRKAHEKKQKTIMDLIRDIAPLMALIIIVVCFMLFFGKAVQPMIDVGGQMVALQEKNIEYVKEVRMLKQDVQQIKAEIIKQNEQNPVEAPN